MERRSFIQMGALSPLIALPFCARSEDTVITHSHITEPKRKIQISGEYDVIVCGSGPAGVSAAIEAGRNGAKTLLVEAHGCLGGVWTSGLLTWILDHKNKVGFMREIEDKLVSLGAVSRNINTGGSLSFDAEVMKLLLEELCIDADVDIMYHTRVVDAVKNKENRISHIITESKTGREAWSGRIFIDATGDGDLAALSGCGFDYGQENDGVIQPFSLLVLVAGINFDEIREFCRWDGDSKAGSPSKKKLLAKIEAGGHSSSYRSPGLYPIRKDLFMMMANHEYSYSPLNSLEVTKATLNARKEVNSIIQALRSTGGPWENMRLIATPEQIGIREGRRIHGLYTVTQDDLVNGARFDDAVCRVTFGIDIHSPTIEGEKTGVSYRRGLKSQSYDIPLRSLIAKDVGCLMMAGRCISGDFIAHSSYRVIGNAVAMGEAAGNVAAKAALKRCLPQEVPWGV